MENAFHLGLEKKGLEICHNILDNGSDSEKEEAIFFVADYSFSKIMAYQSNSGGDGIDLRRAIIFYNKYLNEYPSGKYSKIIQLRLSFLAQNYEKQNAYDEILKDVRAEKYIVHQKYKFLFEILFTYTQPEAYKIFKDTEKGQNTRQLLINYLDEIIVNYPNYELSATYMKILTKIQRVSNLECFSSNYLQYNTGHFIAKDSRIAGSTTSFINVKYLEYTKHLTNLLDSLSAKYPSDNLVLDLHLIFAEAFFSKNDNDEINEETLQHLEYVLKNEKDKLSMRYMLTKEYILNNKFEIVSDKE